MDNLQVISSLYLSPSLFFLVDKNFILVEVKFIFNFKPLLRSGLMTHSYYFRFERVGEFSEEQIFPKSERNPKFIASALQ